MLKSWTETIQQLLFLVRDTHENKVDIEKIEERRQQLSRKVEALAFEIERMREVGRHEHANLILQLNNTLLQFERRLPPDSR